MCALQETIINKLFKIDIIIISSGKEVEYRNYNQHLNRRKKRKEGKLFYLLTSCLKRYMSMSTFSED